MSDTKTTWGTLAEFENPGQLMLAAEKVRDAGYSKWDCHSPFLVHGLDKAMGISMTKLPVFVFFCGLTGLSVGLLLQWFTNATDIAAYAPMPVQGFAYPISGKPDFSLPANIPVIFEMTILFSAFGAVFGMLGLNKLPTLYSALFTSKKFRSVTTDGFFISIEASDPKFDESETSVLLQNAGAVGVEILKD